MSLEDYERLQYPTRPCSQEQNVSMYPAIHNDTQKFYFP